MKVVAVEPASSPVLSQGKAGSHKIQGIGAGFVPDVLDTKIYDEIISVENDDAFAAGKLVGKKEGVPQWEFPPVRRSGQRSNLQEETGKRRKDDRGTASGYRRQIPFHTVICGLRKRKTDKIYEKDCGSISVDMWICSFMQQEMSGNSLLHKRH